MYVARRGSILLPLLSFCVGEDNNLIFAAVREEGKLDGGKLVADQLDELERICNLVRDARTVLLVLALHDWLQARFTDGSVARGEHESGLAKYRCRHAAAQLAGFSYLCDEIFDLISALLRYVHLQYALFCATEI